MNDLGLRRMTFGFRGARAVMAGVALGVFESLADAPKSAARVASICGLDVRGTLALLDALAALGVLHKDGEQFANTPRASATLTENGPRSRCHVLLHDLWHWGLWGRLEEAVRTGAPLKDRSGDPFFSDPRILSAFFPNLAHAMRETSRTESRRMAMRLELRGNERLLDLGGGVGNFAVALARRYPGLRAVVVDLPPVAQEARRWIEKEGVADRVRVHAADFIKDSLEPLGNSFDVVLLSRVVMGLDDEDAVGLLERTREQMVPGGRVLLHEFHRSESDRSDPVSALLSLDMLLLTGGTVRRASELIRLLAQAGFENTDVRGFGARAVLAEGRRRERS